MIACPLEFVGQIRETLLPRPPDCVNIGARRAVDSPGRRPAAHESPRASSAGHECPSKLVGCRGTSFIRAGVDTSALSATARDSSRVYVIVNTGEGQTFAETLGDAVAQRFPSAKPIAKYPTADVYQLQ